MTESALPLLCIVEAKKDDFEHGLAQCLVEMKACQWNNQQIDRAIDVFGIVINGDTWRFKLVLDRWGSTYQKRPLISTCLIKEPMCDVLWTTNPL